MFFWKRTFEFNESKKTVNKQEIKAYLDRYKKEGKQVFMTSSFQTQSVPLLHIISEIDRSIPIYCLNTGYLFPETLEFKDNLINLLSINIIELFPNIPKNLQKNNQGRLLFTSDTDYCCDINKIQPLEPILFSKDVWISGVRGGQSKVRKNMQTEQEGKHGVMRFHPLLSWTQKDIYDYIREYNLPKHPLENDGYISIGCEPCTRRMTLEDMTDERQGRWFGSNKTECGLHTELVK